ncbi:hypothetical protein [Zoogloea sp.]|uniref:hypothetical protein n=1 Tax=Zoogloea sp. TaxID=49181 RepID=UPI00262635F9|nr:hypothetical protein [Zoogloea sp.]MDD3353019.1 hypothetical protein [Zoogloea sp.]
MISRWRLLWTVTVSHAFQGGPSAGLGFSIPESTRTTLAGLGGRVRESAGQLQVAQSLDEDGQPKEGWSGQALLFGLHPRDPNFERYTLLPPLPRTEIPLFANESSPDDLPPQPRGIELTGPHPSLQPRLAQRPLQLRLSHPDGKPVAGVRLGPTDERWRPPFPLPPGEYQLDEDTGNGTTARRQLLVDAELASCRPWGLLRLHVAPAHLSLPHGQLFTLSLASRPERLRYYLVLTPTDDADLASLSVVDNRLPPPAAPVLFSRRDAADFDESHLSPIQLGAVDARRVVLFEAMTELPRQARGPQGFELHRQEEVLVANLPQPGAERSDAQFVIHLK